MLECKLGVGNSTPKYLIKGDQIKPGLNTWNKNAKTCVMPFDPLFEFQYVWHYPPESSSNWWYVVDTPTLLDMSNTGAYWRFGTE